MERVESADRGRRRVCKTPALHAYDYRIEGRLLLRRPQRYCFARDRGAILNSARSRISQLGKFIKEYLIVGLSGLLDRQYYAATNPDVQQARSDPIAHYLSHGWQEGRDPSEAFDTLAYMEQNRDVHFAAINPLVHYVIWRVREGRRAGSDAHNSAASAAARPEPTPRIRRPLNWVLSRTYAPWPRAGGRYPVVPPGSFSFPSSEVMRRHEAALTNWNGVRTKLVARDGKLWAIKRSGTSADNRRERLVYALSRGLVNAAEVVPLSSEEILRLFAMNLVENNAFPGNTFLVRLAQDYSKDELPLQDIDSATAGETGLFAVGAPPRCNRLESSLYRGWSASLFRLSRQPGFRNRGSRTARRSFLTMAENLEDGEWSCTRAPPCLHRSHDEAVLWPSTIWHVSGGLCRILYPGSSQPSSTLKKS